jgi:FkbM family methyltransferase
MPRGFRMRFYPSSISAALWSDPRSRREDEDFVWAVLRAGDRCIDAGANIGQLTLAASIRVGATGEVIAIEPHPDTYRYLRGNLDLNRCANVRAMQIALGDELGEVALTSRRSDDQNYVADRGELRVPVRRMDDVVAPEPTRLLKLDVEGYELQVLRGAQRVLNSTSIVYCELSTGNCRRYGYDPGEVEQLLADAGFVFVRTDAARQLTVTPDPHFSDLESHQLPATGYNLVAVRPSIARELVERLSAEGWTHAHARPA